MFTRGLLPVGLNLEHKSNNLGDDTDTVGAVAGGLASSFYGADQIPEEWINVIAGREYIKELCSNTLA